MKGHAGAAPPWKRRFRGPSLLVPALVVFSLLLPLAFLFGILNHFPYGYLGDERPPTEEYEFGGHGHRLDGSLRLVKGEHSKVPNLVKKLGPDIAKDGAESIVNPRNKVFYTKIDEDPVNSRRQSNLQVNENVANSHSDRSSNPYSDQEDIPPPLDGLSPSQLASSKPHPAPNATNVADPKRDGSVKHFSGDANGKSCQLEFGSYCLWSLEHKEVMVDSLVKRLKDQVFLARAYYPSIAKLPSQDNLSRELKLNIQEHERMLSEAIVDADLPLFVEKKMRKMDLSIAKAKSCAVDCNNVDKKLRQILDLTEDETHFHMKQSAFMYHLGVQTMPKSHHCLSMRLTVEYFRSPPIDIEQTYAHKLDNPLLRHHIIFSTNILAASVAINSTVTNSEETGNLVFHLLTDVQNYFAMKLWFARISYKEATIHVLNFDKLLTDSSYAYGSPLSPSEEYRVSIHSNEQPPPVQIRTEYLSVFGGSHFLLPQIFKHLNKVLILDDDVVVQRDLSFLWKLDLEGKVNGAMEFCGVRLNQLKSYLGATAYNGNACAWMSGLNIVDLNVWREQNVSNTYEHLLRKVQSWNEVSVKAAALPITLIAFQELIYALDDSMVLSGLGHSYGVSTDALRNAPVLHYNGNMKPWLELGIPSYKKFWRKYLTKERFMDECNVSV
ncbi:putative polygalacturonate 4-alpha-galacturonosyltransferase [Dioscorea sansibarensis]